MRFGVVGDVHGEFEVLGRLMRSHRDLSFWLSVGDVASDALRYPEPAARLYWIKGNNEDFDLIAGLGRQASASNLHFLPNGTCHRIDGIAVAALGGTLAPTWYETPVDALPYPGAPAPLPVVRDDKRRHFVREEVEACKQMRGVDVLLTHEAPRPFIVVTRGRRIDAGKTPINEVLAAMHPKVHFFGHHHRFSDTVRDGVRSIGLDLVTESFVAVETPSFDVQFVSL